MKILHVIPYFAPRFGGDVAVAYSLTRQLTLMGHDCTLITSDYMLDREYVDSLERQGVEVLAFRCLINMMNYYYTPGMKKWLSSNITDYDIVHLHDFRSYQSNIVMGCNRKTGIPYVIQPHGSTPRVMGKKLLKWLYDIMYGYRVIRKADHIIAVSREESIYDRTVAGEGTPVSVVYNGMDIEGFSKKTATTSIKKKYNINGRMLLYLGRLNKTKGIDFSLRAFSALSEEIDNLYYVIAGPDDGYEAELRRLCEELNISEKIVFTGLLDEEERLSAYSEADVFIHTVRYMGGVGLAPLEAVLTGTPVIVTDECGEVIRDAECGYIAEFGDIDDLTRKMKKVITESSEGREMVERGKKYISENLTWEKVAGEIERIYSGVLR